MNCCALKISAIAVLAYPVPRIPIMGDGFVDAFPGAIGPAQGTVLRQGISRREPQVLAELHPIGGINALGLEANVRHPAVLALPADRGVFDRRGRHVLLILDEHRPREADLAIGQVPLEIASQEARIMEARVSLRSEKPKRLFAIHLKDQPNISVAESMRQTLHLQGR